MSEAIFSKYFIPRPSSKRHSSTSFTDRLKRHLLPFFYSESRWEKETSSWYSKGGLEDPWYKTDHLFPWEEHIIKNYLPPPPASILVLAAGFGREMRALSKLGYSVYGMDIDGAAIHYASSTIRGESLLGVTKASFLDISSCKVPLPKIDFQVVIFGWGSISHIPSESCARLLFNRIAQQLPKAKVILSSIPMRSTRRYINRLRLILSYLPFSGSKLQGVIHPSLGPVRILNLELLARFLSSFGYFPIYSKEERHFEYSVFSLE